VPVPDLQLLAIDPSGKRDQYDAQRRHPCTLLPGSEIDRFRPRTPTTNNSESQTIYLDRVSGQDGLHDRGDRVSGRDDNQERPHQGLEGRFVVPASNENNSGPIQCRNRLGGLLHFYHRQAA